MRLLHRRYIGTHFIDMFLGHFICNIGNKYFVGFSFIFDEESQDARLLVAEVQAYSFNIY